MDGGTCQSRGPSEALLRPAKLPEAHKVTAFQKGCVPEKVPASGTRHLKGGKEVMTVSVSEMKESGEYP